MKNAAVLVPFSGYITVYVDDLPDETTEEEAFDLAQDKIPSCKEEAWRSQLGEINYHKYLNRGNVCNVVLGEFEVEWEKFEND